VQVEQLEVLEQDPAVALRDGLRQAGRARRVEHPQRVVEGDWLEGEFALPAEKVLPGHPIAQAADVGLGAQPGQHDCAPEPRDLVRQLGDDLEAVEAAAVVAVAVDGEQHRGLDLRQAVDHAAGAEVRRAARPRGPEAGGRQERGERLGDVGHVRGHAVGAPYPLRP
jgi:hypothetical protein